MPPRFSELPSAPPRFRGAPVTPLRFRRAPETPPRFRRAPATPPRFRDSSYAPDQERGPSSAPPQARGSKVRATCTPVMAFYSWTPSAPPRGAPWRKQRQPHLQQELEKRQMLTSVSSSTQASRAYVTHPGPRYVVPGRRPRRPLQSGDDWMMVKRIPSS